MFALQHIEFSQPEILNLWGILITLWCALLQCHVHFDFVMIYRHGLLAENWPFLFSCSDGRFNICADASGPGYGDNEQDCPSRGTFCLLQPLPLPTLLLPLPPLIGAQVQVSHLLGSLWYPKPCQGTCMHAEPIVWCALCAPYVGSSWTPTPCAHCPQLTVCTHAHATLGYQTQFTKTKFKDKWWQILRPQRQTLHWV